MAATFSYEEIRAAVLGELRSQTQHNSNRNPSASYNFLTQLDTPERHTNNDDFAIGCEVWHDLYLERIIRPGVRVDRGSYPNADMLKWPFFQVTSYGRSILERGFRAAAQSGRLLGRP